MQLLKNGQQLLITSNMYLKSALKRSNTNFSCCGACLKLVTSLRSDNHENKMFIFDDLSRIVSQTVHNTRYTRQADDDASFTQIQRLIVWKAISET